MSVQIGRVHRHYKGGLYVPIAIAETHQHNGDQDVIYVSLTTGKIVSRPLTQDSRKDDSWTDLIDWPDEIRRCRFKCFSPGYDPFERNPALFDVLKRVAEANARDTTGTSNASRDDDASGELV